MLALSALLFQAPRWAARDAFAALRVQLWVLKCCC